MSQVEPSTIESVINGKDTTALADTYTPVFKKEFKKKDIETEEIEFANAKAFLSTKFSSNNETIYDHLTSIVTRILETKQTNAFESFENISAEAKKQKFRVEDPNSSHFLKATPDPAVSLQLSQAQMSIFTHGSPEEAKEEVGEIPDIMDLSRLWDWAGLSFGQEETFVLLISLKKLIDEKPIKSIRLWGKIFGIQMNYIIVEAELTEGSEEEEAAAKPVESESKLDADLTENVAEKNPEEDETDAPKPKQKPVPVVPLEQKSGANKYVYFVCSYAGGEWTRLPDVIPEKLQISRKIRKYFSGDLTKKIVSFPPFDDTEAQYLRCQIARISSATVVSPAGYYMPDPEEAEGENPGAATIIINTEYEGLPNDQLLNAANWVHHVPYILPQGRMVWENPFSGYKGEEEGREDDEEAEEREEEIDPGANLEPETGPIMLSTLNGDEELGEFPAWVSRYCSSLSPKKFSPVVLRSNRWVGASVVSYNDKFTNLYIGDGLKDLGNPVPKFAPIQLPEIQNEYATGEVVIGSSDLLIEQIDPTVEAEAALEEEKRAKEEALKAEEGGEPEEAEEEE